MLYGRRLDQALQHVDGSRYALVHAVAKRARQITLWLTADPAELRAEAMDVSDRWIEAGCDPRHPLLAEERALLVRSYAALLAAVYR